MKQRKMKAERWVDAFLQHSWKTRLLLSEWRAADDESSLERKAEAWKEKTRTGNEVKMATDRKEELLQKSSNLGWKNLIRKPEQKKTRKKWKRQTGFFAATVKWLQKQLIRSHWRWENGENWLHDLWHEGKPGRRYLADRSKILFGQSWVKL